MPKHLLISTTVCLGPKKKKGPPLKVGGIAFFASLFLLGLLGLLNLACLPTLLDRQALGNWLYFSPALMCGALLARFLVRGHLSVFLHELKHSILANLAGNKAGKMRIRSRSGEFAYKYSAETAPYNAFIALAPYLIPIFSFAALALSLPFFYDNQRILLLALGLGYGMDMVLNLRDISPHQPDIYLIRGGYLAGLAYIIAMNLTLFTIVAAWVCQGTNGLTQLLENLWRVGLLFLR